jgi:hypothetical protein
MIRETVLFRMRYLLQFAAAMRDFGCTVCALEAPGPFSHDPALARTPAARVDGIRRLCRETVAEALDALGVEVIAVPAACRGADGILADHLRNESPSDTYHAGAEFGAIMLATMLDRYAAPDALTRLDANG